MRPRIVIGVIGGGFQPTLAFDLGYAIAVSGHVLLTGGVPVEGSDETKDRAMCGAVAAERAGKGTVRSIGVLDSRTVRWDTSKPFQLILSSGLSSWQRDAINGVTPDVVIALRGSVGTLCETAFAAAVGRPILFMDSVAFLAKKHVEKRATLVKALRAASGCYPNIDGTTTDPGRLETALLAALRQEDYKAHDPQHETDLVIAHAVTLARRKNPIGSNFPGLPGDRAGSAATFETIFSHLLSDEVRT